MEDKDRLDRDSSQIREVSHKNLTKKSFNYCCGIFIFFSFSLPTLIAVNFFKLNLEESFVRE